ncbi:iron ABC transporter permease [Morganella morganii subsp. morganii]|nr:iron ABC transporter permease [Morganella morganii]MBT0397383.1 iron ABC transporter permease [Morganella morganii subsp. morganii]ELF0882523.1 iron ABC transporter permease [Morganella morganii]MBT0461568.1 iron ABC transporter permease [Morganella morganii subsp. morganii]MBT0518564.1 iron ABC transporter permease [Morganella morganii subsp. morganii]
MILTAMNTGGLPVSVSAFLRGEVTPQLWQIWLSVRLPRIVLAVLVGMALATAGVLLQGLFRNPLADPGLLGISSGAAVAVALGIVFIAPYLSGAVTLYLHIITAFSGALCISGLIFLLNRRRQPLLRLLLCGIAVNAISMSFVGVLNYLSDDKELRQFSLWMMGSTGHISWTLLLPAIVLALPVFYAAFRLARPLDIIQLGEEEAHYAGVNVRRTQQCVLLISALLTGIAVALSGIIGFIGLVIPHLMRMIFGWHHLLLLVTSALAGALLLLLSDTLARTLVVPAEIPVGLLTGLLGAPYFLWLIFSVKD